MEASPTFGTDVTVLPAPVGEYRRRRPQETVLYQVIQDHYLTFLWLREEEGRPLPGFIRREFEKYLVCGRLSEGFARVRCGSCGYDRLVAFSCRRRGWCPSCVGRRMNDGAAFLTDHLIGDTPVRQWVLSFPRPLRYILAYDSAVLGDVVNAFVEAVFQFLRWKAKDLLGLRSVSLAHPGAVTLIQRGSSDLSLNVHLHVLVTDGIYVQESPFDPVSFHELPPPTDEEVADVAQEACRRVRVVLMRHDLWKDATEDPAGQPVPENLADLYEGSIRGVLVVGPRRGQRVVRFFGEAARRSPDGSLPRPSGDAFNLHARQATFASDRAAVERLARYILRPPLAIARMERRDDGRIAITMKRPWRDGTAGVLFEPLELLGRLAALIPRPRVNIIRFHGVYAPRARLRREVVPAAPREPEPSPAGCTKHASIRCRSRLPWAELLARVFAIDVLACPRCQSRMSRIAWITDTQTIEKILRAVGLPTDSPVFHPPRTPEEPYSLAGA